MDLTPEGATEASSSGITVYGALFMALPVVQVVVAPSNSWLRWACPYDWLDFAQDQQGRRVVRQTNPGNQIIPTTVVADRSPLGRRSVRLRA